MDTLLQRLKGKDETAYAEVFNDHRSPLYFFILSIIHNTFDAEDLMMITFEKAFRGVVAFVPDFKFSTWLYEIARNTSIDYLRAKKRIPLGDEIDGRIMAPILNPEQELIMKEHRALIEKKINSFTQPHFKDIMIMYLDGFKIKEISEKLDLPIGTVLPYILRAKKELKKLIE